MALDPNFVRVVNPNAPGRGMVLHRRDLKPTDVLFDEAVHGMDAIKTAEAQRIAEENARAEAQRTADEKAAKKQAEPAKAPEAVKSADPKPSAPVPAAKK